MASKAQAKSSQRRSARGVRYETDLTRQIGIRSQRRTLLVVTNGERTERDYFDALKMEPWVIVTLRVKFERGTAEDAVVRAVRVRNNDEYDFVWAVCDVDEEDVSNAALRAKDGRVDLALSKPCFEVWLILHKSEKCPRFNNAAQASVYLRKLVPAWDKTNLRFPDFRAGVASAIERSRKLGEPPLANPSTAVWRLVECLAESDD